MYGAPRSRAFPRDFVHVSVAALLTYLESISGMKEKPHPSDSHCTCVVSTFPLQSNPKAGEPRNWRSSALLLAIPPRLVLPPLICWEPGLPAELAEAAKATPTWMAETTKVMH